MSGKAKTTIYLPPETLVKVKHAAVDAGLSETRYMEEAVKARLGGELKIPNPVPEATDPVYDTPRGQRLMAMLRDILAYGEPDAIRAAELGLRLGHSVITSREEERARGITKEPTEDATGTPARSVVRTVPSKDRGGSHGT